jgi:hypothetical protein
MGKNGGKKPHKDKERPPGSSESTKATTAKPTLTPATGSHNNPKVTPQAPKGAVPSQQSGSGPKLTPTNAPNNATNNAQAKAIGVGESTFHIPKGGDKRGRDPSLGSKASGQSMVPPPSKQPRTYANAAKGHDHRVQDQQWPELQLRVYKNTIYHEPVSYDDFGAVRATMLQHSLSFLEENPDQGSLLQISSTYYNKLIHCGVYNFANMQALNWFKRELPKACHGAFRGWTRDEQVTTFVKIFVPNGFESLLAQDYLKASRLMFRSNNAPDIPWGLINESIHPTKHTRQIIASIPTATLQVIQARGTETGRGVWKADGFLAPFKIAIASSHDMRNANAATTPNQSSEHECEQVETPLQEEAMVGSPSTSPAHSTASSTSHGSCPLGPELTPSRLPGLINDPLLSEAADVTEENDNQNEENMDFRLLDEDVGVSGSWADGL